MDGLYLYCIREEIGDTPVFSCKGIDGKGQVFVVRYRKLEAVVSKVPLQEFGSEEIQKRAKEDLAWIKEKGVAHERVIEEAMRDNGRILSLIPMRFGTIFKEKEKLEESLNQDFSKIKKVIERIRDKQEWSVKVYLKDKKKFEQAVKERNEVIKEREREIASEEEGLAFFMEEELNEVISKELDRELKNIAKDLFESLGKQAVAKVKNKILEKELTGKREPMVLNAAYLIPQKKVKNFKEDANKINQEIQARGFYLEYSGPWPAYNFTTY